METSEEQAPGAASAERAGGPVDPSTAASAVPSLLVVVLPEAMIAGADGATRDGAARDAAARDGAASVAWYRSQGCAVAPVDHPRELAVLLDGVGGVGGDADVDLLVLTEPSARPEASWATMLRMIEVLSQGHGAVVGAEAVVDALQEVEAERLLGPVDRGELYTPTLPVALRRELVPIWLAGWDPSPAHLLDVSAGLAEVVAAGHAVAVAPVAGEAFTIPGAA